MACVGQGPIANAIAARYMFVRHQAVIAASLLSFTALTLGCGYTLTARPELSGGVTKVLVPVVENDTPETEVGVLLSAALSRRAEADGRLAGRGEQAARLLGRVESIRATPVAFPSASQGAGMYALSMRVSLRLMPAGGGGAIGEVTIDAREEYLAGAGPEETEAHRRLALERLCARIADEGWSYFTAP